MTGWIDTHLGDVITLKRGYDLPKRARRDGPVPVVSSSGPTGSHSEVKADPPGVVTGRYGTLGKVFFVDVPYWPLNTTLYVQDFKGAHARFVAYFLESMSLEMYNGAAAVPGLDRNVLHGLPIRWPSRDIQQRASAVLAAYDELIENNLRRIEILEEMAQAIYREWFVNFRFPGHEDTAMADSALGPIPEGWEVCRFGQICSRIQAGSTPSRSISDFWSSEGMDWYKTGELHDGFLLGSSEHLSDTAPARVFDPGTLLMAIYGSPTVGRMGVVVDAASANQAALGMVPDRSRLGVPMLFHLLLNQRAHFNSIAQGAAQQNISKAKVEATEVVLPSASVVESFERVVQPGWDLRLNLARQNTNLRITRDLLLPKLVSGEIDVSDLDIDADWLVA